MVTVILGLLGALRSALRTRAGLALENLALRQQLANLPRTSSRARLRNCDRAFWLVLSRFWSRWADALVVVKPDTVLRWHRAGFRLFWRWKSRSHGPAEGSVAPEVRRLIRQMAEANVGWGAPRIHGELLQLGIEIGERSVSRFMPPKPRKPPSQTWRTFLDNHVGSLASIDFGHGAHCDVSRSVCLLRLGPRPPPRSSLQRHRPPQRGLDRPADRRGVPRGHGAQRGEPTGAPPP